MSWRAIPHVQVLNFTGQPMRLPKLDENAEEVYQPIHCPGTDCEESFTNLEQFQNHVASAHDIETAKIDLTLRYEMEIAYPGRLVLSLLRTFNNLSQSAQGAFTSLRKTNDAYQATLVWARAWLSYRKGLPLRLKEEQYRWLKGLLLRAVPFTKAEREQMGLGADEKTDPRTVADYLYSMSAYSVCQVLMAEGDSDRDALELEESYGIEVLAAQEVSA